VALPPLRVWLESGYDGGRFGAWLLDVPGAFGHAASRDLAISQSSAALGWFRDWLARHGEMLDVAFGWPDVVEECVVEVADGYQRGVTFADDAHAVTAGDVDAAIRRLGFAREDLLTLRPSLARVAIPTHPGERALDDVMRHVAGVEIWLGSRLDPGARYAGPAWDGDGNEHLAATRTWADANLRSLFDTHALPRVDSKGEQWTLRKVVRRYVYHAVDHLRELDLRLARAEARHERLVYSDESFDAPAPLIRLLRSVGWDRRTQDPELVRAMLAGSRRMASAWDGSELIAFARESGDGVFSSLISTVCTDPRWQGMGIGARLVRSLVEGRPGVRFALHAAPGMTSFYERLGFEPDETAMYRRRAD
jgi:GNAT superfamily N-acetyltransferase